MDVKRVARPEVKVQIVSDVICPWCWIGKKKLEQALSVLGDKFSFQMSWEPYFLKPDIPPEGIHREKRSDQDAFKNPR